MIRRFLSCYRPYTRLLAVVMTGSVLAAGLETGFPMIVRHILNDILPARDMARLWQTGLLLLGLYVLCLLISFAVCYCGRKMGVHIEHDLRCRLFEHIEGLSFSFFDTAQTGQLVSRIISDISEIGDLVFQLPNLVLVCVITMAGSAFFMFSINWQLALLVLFVLGLKTLDTVFLNGRMKQTFFLARQQMGRLSARAAESFSAIRVIQSFAAELYELERFRRTSTDVRCAQQRTYLFEAYLMSTVVFFTNLNNLIIIAAGSYYIMMGTMTVADLVVFLMYLLLFIRPIMQLTLLTERYQRSMAGFRRYTGLMDTPPAVTDCPHAIDAGMIRGRIEFRHVSFSYEKGPAVLHDFNLTIEPGETVAVVGGKSSIASLLPRFYDVTAGEILLDGRDIRSYTLASLRRAVGMVQQDVFLFAGSVRENIALGDEMASPEAVRAAAAAADAHDFICSLPDGYDSFIGERGVLLSGGQKQRIAIARIFLKNPPVLILDEATSSLDNETEQKIQESLRSLSAHRTTLIIAHRLATIRHADRILVLTKEGVAESGTHDELMSRHGWYYQLYEAQFDEET